MKYKVTILFKSGNKLEFTTKDFTVTKDNENNITSIEWTGFNNEKCKLMYVRVGEIECIYTERILRWWLF